MATLTRYIPRVFGSPVRIATPPPGIAVVSDKAVHQATLSDKAVSQATAQDTSRAQATLSDQG